MRDNLHEDPGEDLLPMPGVMYRELIESYAHALASRSPGQARTDVKIRPTYDHLALLQLYGLDLVVVIIADE